MFDSLLLLILFATHTGRQRYPMTPIIVVRHVKTKFNVKIFPLQKFSQINRGLAVAWTDRCPPTAVATKSCSNNKAWIFATLLLKCLVRLINVLLGFSDFVVFVVFNTYMESHETNSQFKGEEVAL